jgi:hypothetical protein
MTIQRFSQTFMNMANNMNPQNAPGTVGRAQADWRKSPLLSGLPKGGTNGLYRGGVPTMQRTYYKQKSTDAQISQMREILEQQKLAAQGGIPVHLSPNMGGPDQLQTAFTKTQELQQPGVAPQQPTYQIQPAQGSVAAQAQFAPQQGRFYKPE